MYFIKYDYSEICCAVFFHVLTSKLIPHLENILHIIGSTKSIPNKNVCYCTGCRSGNRTSNGMPGVGASEGVDDSVSVEDRRGNGPLGRATRGDHLPTNDGGGSRSPQGEPSSADENVLASNQDGLEADCLFESTVDAAAAGSSSVDNYVDVDGKEVIATKIVFGVASCLRHVGPFSPLTLSATSYRFVGSYHPYIPARCIKQRLYA